MELQPNQTKNKNYGNNLDKWKIARLKCALKVNDAREFNEKLSLKIFSFDFDLGFRILYSIP